MADTDGARRHAAVIRSARLAGTQLRGMQRQAQDMTADLRALTDYVRALTGDTTDLGPRQRAAATKRDRTRTALIRAAATLLQTQPDPRMEDIAAIADVSVATAYNHFRTKDDLMELLYTGLFARSEPDDYDDVERLITDYVHDLCRRVKTYPGVSMRVLDIAAGSTNFDLRSIWEPLALMFEHGIAAGQFSAGIKRSAEETASYHILALLIRSALVPNEPANITANVVLSQLWPVLI